MKFLFLIAVFLYVILMVNANCRRYVGSTLTAIGDWSLSKWNLYDRDADMKFDNICEYTLVVGGLKANTSYQWKVVVDNGRLTLNCPTPSTNCVDVADSNGGIRFKLNASTGALTSDTVYDSYDTNTCKDPFRNKEIRVVGVWNDWNLNDIFSLMNKDAKKCLYYLPVSGLEINSNKYKWKIVVEGTIYNCGSNDCDSSTDHEGAVRYTFDPVSKRLFTDHNVNQGIILPPSIVENPVIPCRNSLCLCTSTLKGRIVKATGNWAVDAGSQHNWDAAEPLGLLTYDENTCLYFLTLEKVLKANYQYEWKISIDNSFEINYGCGQRGSCKFTTNISGSVRLKVDPINQTPTLSYE